MTRDIPSSMRTRCPGCGRELSQHERFSGGFCSDWQCRRRRTDEAVRALRRALEQQAAGERELEAVRRGDAALRDVPTVVVHWFEAALEPVPEVQRQALRAHLERLEPAVDALLESSAGAAPDASVAQPERRAASETQQRADSAAVDALLGQVCARCTGHCCQLGNGCQAFLDAPALLRARLARPEASHAEIVEAYMAAIADLHFAGSCAYHGVHGCVLPRASRSDVCNSWQCDGLIEARRFAENAGVRQVYVMRHGPDHAAVGAFAPPLEGADANG